MGTTTVHLTADVVLLAWHEGELQVLLVRRGWPPYQGCWALPGGHVEKDETFEAAARRELAEETGIQAPTYLRRLDVYGDPGRDPRGRVVSVAYTAVLSSMPTPAAGDDARAARWVPAAAVLHGPEQLAFDHHQILTDAIAHL